MTRERLYLPNITENLSVSLSGEEAHYLRHVLRLTPESTVGVFDGVGGEFRAKIEPVRKNEVRLFIGPPTRLDSPPNLKLVLIQSLPKLDKMETIIQKACELGVAAIWPLRSDHCVMRLDERQFQQKKSRWEKVGIEACRQCGRTRIPEIGALRDWDETLEALPSEALGLIADETNDSNNLKSLLNSIPNPTGPVYVIVGPEGGFSERELNRARASKVHSISLGPRILRTETAGPALLAILQYHWGDIG